MPQSISYPDLAKVLPLHRQTQFREFLHTDDPVKRYGGYIWTLRIAASIHPLISTLEITLRNAIHQAATQAIGDNWYEKLATRTRKSWKTKDKDARNIAWHLSKMTEKKLKISRKYHAKKHNIHDLIISACEFGIWVNLFGECFIVNGNKSSLWPQCIQSVFPNLPKGKSIQDIQKELSELKELRNNIAHHSLLWSGTPINHTTDAITYVNEQIDRIIALTSWLSTSKIQLLDVHMLIAEARRVATSEYLSLCQRQAIDEMSTPPSQFNRSLNQCMKSTDSYSFTLIKHKKSLWMMTRASIY